jgi:hypothetical protein
VVALCRQSNDRYRANGQFGFGNATELSVQLIRGTLNFKDINLDSDRGYGYRQWTASGGISAGTLSDESFV